MERSIIILLAFALDLLFGDPTWIPHPICAIGALISKTERFLRAHIKNELVGGALLVLIVTFVCFALPFALLTLCYAIHFALGFAVEVFFCFQIFAAKSLKKAAFAVFAPLMQGDLAEARKQVSYIVGRDTQSLTQEGVIKATVETVAENTTDGVVAPLVFMALGGAPLAFFYKGINTMDSMVGYKNEKYLLFGRCAAKLDDIANYIPARIAAYCMILCAFLFGFDGKNAAKIYRRDRHNHKSPNSAQTESVCAGALGVELAGNASYFGNVMQKPTIGDAYRPIAPEDIKRTCTLMFACSGTLVLLVTAILALVATLAR